MHERVKCCRKSSVNLSRYSEAIVYTNIFRDMGKSNDSINGILLENVDKEIPINFSLLTTPVKDNPYITKTSNNAKLENYIDENYDKAAKIQLKQAIYGKYIFLMRQKKKDTLMNFFAVFTIKFPNLKVKLAF